MEVRTKITETNRKPIIFIYMYRDTYIHIYVLAYIHIYMDLTALGLRFWAAVQLWLMFHRADNINMRDLGLERCCMFGPSLGGPSLTIIFLHFFGGPI